MNSMIWDAVVWLRKKLKGDKEDIILAVNNIQNLFETSADATASPSDILKGQTAYNGTVLMTGTMENQGAKEATLLAGGVYNIPRGYHNGAGRVTATDLASQTAGTATAGGILLGLKAWVAGRAINGTMKDRRGVTVTAGAVTQDDNYTYLSIPEEACYNANSKVRTPNSNIRDMSGTFWLRSIGINSRINFNTNKRWSKIDITQIDDRSQTDNNNPADGVQIIGDGTVIATIKDFTKHTYTISNYNVIQISVFSYHTYGTYRIY